MEFKQWLINEVSSKFNLNIDPSITSFALKMKNGELEEETDFSKLKAFLKGVLNDYFIGDLSNAAARYDFNLKEIREDYTGLRFEFKLVPKGGIPELSTPDNPMHDIYVKHKGGMTGYKTYKTPKEATKEIPNNPNYGYRGMSWEEWQYIRKTGHIMSKGGYNFESQKNLTFYGDASTALAYGSGFAPMAYQTSLKRPSIVIAIPRGNLKDHTENPNIPQGELAHEGPLDSKEIVGAWMLVPSNSKSGILEIVFTWIPEKNEYGEYTGAYSLGKPKEGTRSSPYVGYVIKKIK